MAHQVLVLQNSSEDPALHPSLDQGNMGLCCCSCHDLSTMGERERPGDVSVVLGFFPPPILGARILTSTGNPRNQRCIGNIITGSLERVEHEEQRPNPTHVTLINVGSTLLLERAKRFRFKYIKTHSHRGIISSCTFHSLSRIVWGVCCAPCSALCTVLCTCTKWVWNVPTQRWWCSFTLTQRWPWGAWKWPKGRKPSPASCWLLGTRVPLLWVTSLSPPTLSSVSEVRELPLASPAGCCCRHLLSFKVWRKKILKKANIHFYIYSSAAQHYLCKL